MWVGRPASEDADLYQPAVCVIGWPSTYTCMRDGTQVWDPLDGQCEDRVYALHDAPVICGDDSVPYRDAADAPQYCLTCPTGLVALGGVCTPCAPATYEDIAGLTHTASLRQRSCSSANAVL